MMFLTEKKLLKQVKELGGYRYHVVEEITAFRAIEKVTGETFTFHKGDLWKGRDRYVSLEANFQIPPKKEGFIPMGYFDFGKTDQCYNDGFESLLYVEGKPYQGVDQFHKEVLWDDELEGRSVEVRFDLWSGLEGGGVPRELEHRFVEAKLAYLDCKVDAFYYLSKAILETSQLLSEETSNKYQLINVLDKAYNMIDFGMPGDDYFYNSIYEALDYLNKKLEGMPSYKDQVTVNLIGHTHIDVAWLWRLKHTREKAARSFSTVLNLMKFYPDYIFFESQPQLYDYIKEDHGDLYQLIQKKVEEKKWETGGGMWLEADCNIPSGESLVRQIIYGDKFLQREFGTTSKFLWLPDVFGYSWALPQILKQSNMDTFITTKISWNQYNRFPHDTFVWKGIDGSEVITHFVSTPYDPRREWAYTYTGEITPYYVKGIWEFYQDKGLNQDLLLTYGYGDGGGGVTREMLAYKEAMDKIPSLPEIKLTRVDDFVEKLHHNVENTDGYLHTWDGELYLEYHRGTYTSEASIKKHNRKTEFSLREAEYMGVQNGRQNGWDHYPQEELDKAWEILLRNQFHDILPGSSIKEVYEDAEEEFKVLDNYVKAIEEMNQHGLMTYETDAYTVVNSNCFDTQQLVKLPNKWVNPVVKNAEGEILPCEMHGGDLVVSIKMKGLTSQSIWVEEGEEKEKQSIPFSIDVVKRSIETPYYEMQINEEGTIESLYDKGLKKELINKGKCGNQFMVYEDKPVNYDAWDTDIFYANKQEAAKFIEMKVGEVGELQASFELTYKYRTSTIKQVVTVYKESRHIVFDTEVDWQEKNRLLKVLFDFNIRTNHATYDMQYGNIERPNHWNTSWDYARFEVVGHKWADLSQRDFGVALINDCKYGYSAKGSVLGLSLIKTSSYPEPERDLGYHSFTYAILPHEGDWLQGQVEQEAWAFNKPLHIIEGIPKASLDWLEIDGKTVSVDAIKKSEKGNEVIVRLHEFGGCTDQVEVMVKMQASAIYETNLLEEKRRCLSSGRKVSLELKPYEIKTLCIVF